MDDLFEPPGAPWQRVSGRLATLYRVLTIGPAIIALVAGLILTVLLDPAWIGLVVCISACAAAAAGWTWGLRRQRSWGYAEQVDDLLVARGILFRRLVAIPYGRMQFVDVQAGPLERALGIATVTLHTASVETAASIPGLPAAEATRVRNRLTELGQARGAGL